MAAVRTGITYDGHFICSYRAIFFDTSFHLDTHRMSGPGGDEFFFTSAFINDRTFGSDGQMGCHILDHNFLLGAETATDPWFDDPDPLYWQAENWSEYPA